MERHQARIAVTGASGALGGMMARTLTRLGRPVRLVMRRPGPTIEEFLEADPGSYQHLLGEG